MFHFPSSAPPLFFNKTKVQQPKDTTLYRAPISYISTDLSTAMKNKVSDVNLLHFLNKWDASEIPNKRGFNLKKKRVNDPVDEREAGDKGKREALLVCLFPPSCSLYLPAANSWVWGTMPAAVLLLWLPGSRRLTQLFWAPIPSTTSL